MKEGWVIKKLDEITSKIGSGATPRGGQSSYKESGISLIRSMNVHDHGFNAYKLAFIDDEQASKLKNVTVEENDVLLNITGASVARCCIAPRDILPARVNQHVSIIRLNNDTIESRFLHYALTSKQYKDLLLGIGEQGATRQAITKIQLQNFKIAFPTCLKEQKQIVAILDKAFAAIDQAKANIEKNIQNAQELFQSKLNQIFSQKGDGWEEKTLGEICHVLNGFAFKSKDSVEKSNTQLLRMGNLYQNVLDLSRKPVFYPDSFSEEYNKFLLKEGDLIMSLTGTVDKTDYGYTVRIPKTNVNLLLNQRIMKIDVHDSSSLNKDYLMNYLLSPVFLSRLYSTSSGTRQANLSSRTILTLTINYPSNIKEQHEIVEKLKHLRVQTSYLVLNYANKISNLEELKKSILQKAFAGELT